MTMKQFCAFLFLIFPAMVLLSLAGCANRVAGYAQTLEEEVKATNDVKAGVYTEAPCAMSLGAWGRMEDQRRRDAAFIGCIPDHERYNLFMGGGS